MMKKILVVVFSLSTLFSLAQRINEYEYFIIPTKFNFQRSANQYQLNALLKCQLDEYGYKTVYDNDPLYLNASNPCLFLKADVVSVSSIFLFKLIIEFKDCHNAVVLQSELGSSKQKDLHEAFTEALDGALKSVAVVNYKFNGTSTEIIDKQGLSMAVTSQNSKSVENNGLVKAIQNKDGLANSTADKAVQTPPREKTALIINSLVIESNKSNAVAGQSKVATQKPIVVTAINGEKPETKPAKSIKNGAADQVDVFVVAETLVASNNVLLYAQAIENGFQLIDTTPKVILKIFKTVQPDYYNANVGKKIGVVYKKNGAWIFEYFIDGQLITEPLNIKFCN